MATRVQKVKVGLFIVFCVILIAGGLVLVSGFKYEEKIPYWIEFDESVLGLAAGSDVDYLGVTVGSVKNIYVTEDGHAHVDILISTSKVTLHEGVQAKLALYSLATGVLVVMLEGGDHKASVLAPNSQIPRTPSLVAAVSSRVEGILDDLNAIGTTIRKGLEGMEEGDLNRIADDAGALIADSRKFLDNLGGTLDEVKENTLSGVDDFRRLIDDLRKVAGNVNEMVAVTRDKIAQLNVTDTEEKVRDVLDNMTTLTNRLNESVATLDTVSRSALHEVDNVEYTLRQTLTTATETLESIRTLTNSLAEDPAQLLRGKRKRAGDR